MMTPLDNISAAENFMTVLREGRMIRGAYNDIADDGRHLACAYSAAVSGADTTKNCPAAVMPQEVADLTPWIDDAGTACTCSADSGSLEDRAKTCTWHRNLLRYGTVMARWHVLSPDDWTGILRRFRGKCCVSALASAAKVVPPDAPYWPSVQKASIAISDRLLRGEEPSEAEAAEAAKAAKAVVAARVARAAVWAAVAARVALAAVCAAAAAVWAATWAARAADADALIDHFLTLVETAVAKREAATREAMRAEMIGINQSRNRVGKSRAGRLLDGREWNEMPGALT